MATVSHVRHNSLVPTVRKITECPPPPFPSLHSHESSAVPSMLFITLFSSATIKEAVLFSHISVRQTTELEE